MTVPPCPPEVGALTIKFVTDFEFLFAKVLSTQGSFSHAKLGKNPLGITLIFAVAGMRYLREGSFSETNTASKDTLLSVVLGMTVRFAELCPLTQDSFGELATFAHIETDLYPFKENGEPSGFTKLARKLASFPSSASGEN